MAQLHHNNEQADSSDCSDSGCLTKIEFCQFLCRCQLAGAGAGLHHSSPRLQPAQAGARTISPSQKSRNFVYGQTKKLFFSYKHTLLQEYETNNEVILLFCKFSTMSLLPTKPVAQCGEGRALGFCPNLYSEFSGDAIVRELGCMNTMYWRIAL